MNLRLRIAPRAGVFALVAALALAAGPAASAETVVLPAWALAPDSPIAFPGASRVDPAAATAATLFGFEGIARGVSVSGGRLRVESFELAPPPGGAFVAPRHPLPGFEPVPVFRSLELGPDSRGPFAADCHYVRTPDPFGGTFEEGGANLAWGNWNLIAFELALGADGLRARNGFVVNLREESERDGVLNGDRAAIVAATIVELRFEPGWTPEIGPGAFADPWVSLPGLGDLAVASVTFAVEDGALVALVEPREPGEDEYYLEPAPFERATIDGRGKVTSSMPRAGTQTFGWEGAFELAFEAESAGVPMTGSGLVTLPESLGGRSFRTAPGAVRAWAGSYWEGENYFEVSAFAESVVVELGGWTFTLYGASIGRAGDMSHIWALLADSATVTWRGVPLRLEGLGFAGEGWLLGPGQASGEFLLPGFRDRVTAWELRFDEDGLSALCFYVLPPELGGLTVFLDRMALGADGSISQAWPLSMYGLSLPAGEFTLENLWLGEDGLRFGRMGFEPTRPDFSTARFRGGSFPVAGGVELSDFDPFELGGFTIWPGAGAAVAIRDGVLVVEGSVYYPSAMPSELRRHDRGTARIPLDGSAPSIDSSVEQSITVPYGDGYGGFRAARRAVEYDDGGFAVRLDGVEILTGLGELPGARLDGVRVRADGSWDFSRATLAAPFDWERDGVRATLSKLELVDGERVLFSGRASRSDGNGREHGCALSAGFDGSMALVVADGHDLRWIR